ncbi:DUF1203 domain-containing protein [Paracoccus sp. M683]|uniref:DUF1203 domain-containing protein n=1 Tax=Paracoccus sp. M683 TaxID=2594268 RepID=UPI00117CA388|nr:DUF1203 domain-containing protein [Paracoccus sp. M683]TRW95680.1 DUF1203 domain-containing protein [Paracoccus sp. M683]
MTIRFVPIKTATAWALRDGLDAYGMAPERRAHSDGSGTPCRHCLRQVPKGAPYLIAAHRPFAGLNPYAETGPIFLCAGDCPAAGPGFPYEILKGDHYITRAYSPDERIIYGSGSVTPTDQIVTRCAALLGRSEVAFVDIRSASNNCFLCRVVPG